MPSNSKKKKTGYMYYLSKGTDNPKIFAKLTADGRESLYLEYYFGHKEVFDEKLGQTVVKKDRRKESLKLYLWQAPRTPEERQQNKDILEVAKKIRLEKAQALLSYVLKVDGNGYDAIGENVESIAKPYFCYPNPAQDIVYIEFSPDVECQSVEIYTLDGRMVKTCHGASLQNNAIDISNLNSGVYLMKIRMSDGSEFTERIVKE